MTEKCYRLSEYNRLANVPLDLVDATVLTENFPKRLEVTPVFGKQDLYNLQSYNYVGVIALPNSSCVIEPKTPINNLTHLLVTVYDLIHWQQAYAICTQVEQWCELIVAALLDTVEELLRGGLRQGYSEVNENITGVKGRLDLVRQLGENLGRLDRHRCTYQEFSPDTIENCLIKTALDQVLFMPFVNPDLSRRLMRAQAGLAAVKSGEPRDFNFDNLSFTRLNEHYRKPLALARLVLELTAPAFNSAASNGLRCVPAFLVDMNRLFERYIATQLIRRAGPQANLIVRYQAHDHLDLDARVAIIPDLLVLQNNQPIAIIDTKYKIDDRAADYYQMVAYCVALGVPRAVLVYPAWEGDPRPAIAVRNSPIIIESAPIRLNGSIEQLDQDIDTLLSLIC
ncbi:MAG: hypothetical protein AB1489_21900 [Acidobacteriota bacterium]